MKMLTRFFFRDRWHGCCNVKCPSKFMLLYIINNFSSGIFNQFYLIAILDVWFNKILFLGTGSELSPIFSQNRLQCENNINKFGHWYFDL